MDRAIFCLLHASLLMVTGVCSLDFNQGVIVHLFEWKYSDIAQECEEFLGPRGFKGVQISPPNENLVLPGRPWYERYQPVSYKLTTRSGTKEDLANMLGRCNNVGVRVFADVVPNHMTATVDNCYGTANSTCDSNNYSYPAVPYTKEHFHQPPCSLELTDYDNATMVRVCDLVGLHDLNQTEEYVRQKLVDHFNELIDLGVAGFRVDSAKHMYPEDLAVIYSRLHNLSTFHGFPPDTRAFIYQEVPLYGIVTPDQYIDLGLATEFSYNIEMNRCFRRETDLKSLYSFGPARGFIPSNRSVVFVENHDTERDPNILNYKNPQPYKMAIAFTLSWPYGTKKLMSSFGFSDKDQGPPHDSEDQILTQRPIVGNICSNGWVCQHRWRQVVNMVAFHNVVAGTEVRSWWDNGKNQIAFCRGNKGFIALNFEESQHLNQKLQTCLPEGTYCDIISGNYLGFFCTGKIVEVSNDGTAQIFIRNFDPNRREDGVLAIHVEESIQKIECKAAKKIKAHNVV